MGARARRLRANASLAGRPRRRLRLVLALTAVAAIAAAALSQPGRAVVNAVRRSIGIERAQPALFRLPAAGRLLVAGRSGAWVVAADGSKRRLGDYPQASWSPHGLYVVAAATNQLAAVTPTGTVHWTLSRPQIRFPRWGGTRTDTRIAYLTTSRLHVVAGDGTGDVDAEGLPAAAPVAPAWQPTAADRHVLAYVTTRGRVTVLDPDRGTVRWVSAAYAGPRALAWSPDGKQLALAARTKVVLFDARTGRATAVHVEGVRALAFAPDGRLALLRTREVLLRQGAPLADALRPARRPPQRSRLVARRPLASHRAAGRRRVGLPADARRPAHPRGLAHRGPVRRLPLR